MTMKKKREISSKELRRIYDKWLGNFCYGVTEILNLDSETQMYLWFIVMNGTFYNQTTNPKTILQRYNNAKLAKKN